MKLQGVQRVLRGRLSHAHRTSPLLELRTSKRRNGPVCFQKDLTKEEKRKWKQKQVETIEAKLAAAKDAFATCSSNMQLRQDLHDLWTKQQGGLQDGSLSLRDAINAWLSLQGIKLVCQDIWRERLEPSKDLLIAIDGGRFLPSKLNLTTLQDDLQDGKAQFYWHARKILPDDEACAQFAMSFPQSTLAPIIVEEEEAAVGRTGNYFGYTSRVTPEERAEADARAEKSTLMLNFLSTLEVTDAHFEVFSLPTLAIDLGLQGPAQEEDLPSEECKALLNKDLLGFLDEASKTHGASHIDTLVKKLARNTFKAKSVEGKGQVAALRTAAPQAPDGDACLELVPAIGIVKRVLINLGPPLRSFNLVT
ncbi:hypothetical protein IE81DRAFT_349344 [Ceraceosorus guamensis]|uniref:Uncharacterized protein n=1 Tax=Ceraceosorus guamensis TaxID=1522189 RepID=A0A316VSH0_9BASI|nr:hypothetical protein IE81DRAFT_349344 [Ceraceosorus guamensis]PWN40310.1 hypothetical protein IE81DRAFT_349344 [Ceraceosorus guamensis]